MNAELRAPVLDGYLDGAALPQGFACLGTSLGPSTPFAIRDLRSEGTGRRNAIEPFNDTTQAFPT
jgi:hypothetical protein